MTITEKMLNEEIAGMANALRDHLRARFGQHVGFAILLFDFGDTGSLAYASNGKREDMVPVLEEMAERLKGN